MKHVYIVCQYSNETAFFNRLKALGLIVRNKIDEEGYTRKPEQRIEKCNTPLDILVDTNGDHFVTLKCLPEQADKLPPDNNPAFSLRWRSDDYEEDAEGNRSLKPFPEAEIDVLDDNGVPTGATRMQLVGEII